MTSRTSLILIQNHSEVFLVGAQPYALLLAGSKIVGLLNEAEVQENIH